MKLMYDAVYPQPLNATQYQVAAGYCGGDTPHVWSRAEWDGTAQRYRLPIWVRSNPIGTSQAYADAVNFYNELRYIGCPHGVTVALDFETAVDQAYLDAFDAEMWSLGQYGVVLYGSLDSVTQNLRPSGGYWVADWNNLQDFPDNAVAHQYMNMPNYDLSVISDSVKLWDTRPPVPPVPTVLKFKETEEMFVTIPGKPFYLPVEPSGSPTKPQGYYKYGPSTLNVTAQDAGTLTVEFASNGKWVSGYSGPVEPGGLVALTLPEDGSCRIVRITSGAEIVGYVVNSQVME